MGWKDQPWTWMETGADSLQSLNTVPKMVNHIEKQIQKLEARKVLRYNAYNVQYTDKWITIIWANWTKSIEMNLQQARHFISALNNLPDPRWLFQRVTAPIPKDTFELLETVEEWLKTYGFNVENFEYWGENDISFKKTITNSEGKSVKIKIEVTRKDLISLLSGIAYNDRDYAKTVLDALVRKSQRKKTRKGIKVLKSNI